MDEPPIIYDPTFDSLSYDTKPMVKPVDNLTPLTVENGALKGASKKPHTTPNVFKRTGPSVVLVSISYDLE